MTPKEFDLLDYFAVAVLIAGIVVAFYTTILRHP